MELPPRARRIPHDQTPYHPAAGTTSACAENTPRTGGRSSNPGNYLRVRGEYPHKWRTVATTAELPPRARRIPVWACNPGRVVGTTSACAENTYHHLADGTLNRNYLRVRGEYPSLMLVRHSGMELPPRARRIHVLFSGGSDSGGTTSACAENTGPRNTVACDDWNYLRVRGEYHSDGKTFP